MVRISQNFHSGRFTFEDLWRPYVVHHLVVPRFQALVLIELTTWNA